MTLKAIGIGASIAVAALAIGWSSAGIAKAKKMAEPPPVVCPADWQPVCGEKSGVRTTYANSCWAGKDGSKVVAKGECKAMKPHKKAAKKMAKPAMKK